MSKQNTYVVGEWNAICDVCGFKVKASTLRDRWDGLKVCPKDWESRHPSDFIRATKDDMSVPWTRPEPTDTFLTVDYVADTVGTQDTVVPAGTFNGSTL